VPTVLPHVLFKRVFRVLKVGLQGDLLETQFQSIIDREILCRLERRQIALRPIPRSDGKLLMASGSCVIEHSPIANPLLQSLRELFLRPGHGRVVLQSGIAIHQATQLCRADPTDIPSDIFDSPETPAGIVAVRFDVAIGLLHSQLREHREWAADQLIRNGDG